ncbi:hypothetical protein [Metapseudomonas otitidis]|uniref:hypothetical protein n=1 Tax=Metapseudomonas otitidis TaxID=319939 RepID=UPI0013F61986|nr:hypothetical protein [Pseudomonas otitidis]
MEVKNDNPYQSPEAELQAEEIAHETANPLYRISAVGWATLFGTPLAGAWIVMHNLQLRGKANKGALVWTGSIVQLLLICGLIWLLPESVPALPFTVVQVVTMLMFASALLEDDINQHVEENGAFLSNWQAVGVGVVFMLGVYALVYLSALI